MLAITVKAQVTTLLTVGSFGYACGPAAAAVRIEGKSWARVARSPNRR